MLTAANARDDCAFLHVARDIGDGATFRTIEGWRDKAALDAHLASDAFQAVLNEASTLNIIDRCGDCI